MPRADATFDNTCRVYCAGPLFNQAERTEMTAIAECLARAGFRVYLPHRDGMEFRLVLDVLVERGWSAATAGEFLHAAIFALDVYQLAAECDAMVWNLNGRTPDEGAVAEAAMAWTLGKPLVAYKDDVRSLISGRLNPLLAGMVDFETADDFETLPQALAAACAQTQRVDGSLERLPPKMQRAVRDGGRLWEALRTSSARRNDEFIADVVAELFAPAERAPY
jgi:nucleoside 2-deoxyribosyltransferase